jgi:cytochrome c oxidase subunit 2
MNRVFAGLAATAAGFGAALAQSSDTSSSNTPVDGGFTLLPAASKLAEEVHFFHDGVLFPIISVICLFVLGLLLFVMVKFNAKANPVPRKFSHNMLVEVIWTVGPIMILLFIALFSFDLLFKEDVIPDGKQFVAAADGSTNEFAFDNDFPASRMAAADRHVQVFQSSASGVVGLTPGKDYSLEGLGSQSVIVKLKATPAAGDRLVVRMGRSLVGHKAKEIALAPTVTLKAVGYQWGWTYSYPDLGDFEFSSNMAAEGTVPEDRYRFEVDNRVVVPVGESIRVITTARDVIHAWALPNMAIKIDAVPGRHNETWFKPEREGVYYGQCSEICGVRHSAMPIAVEVVSRPAFEAWVDAKRADAGLEPMFGAVAAAEPSDAFADAGSAATAQ